MTLRPRLVSRVEFDRRRRIADLGEGMGTMYIDQTGQVELAAGPTVIKELREMVIQGCYTVEISWEFGKDLPPLTGKATFWKDNLCDD